MKAFLGLGSNIGDRIIFISKAIEEIKKLDKTSVTAEASIYETEPWGKKDQDDFLNTAVEIETALLPEELFREVKRIEKDLQRKDREKWAEREIDIDILFYGDKLINDDLIIIPHAQIENRKFVLVPMNEIAPGFVHPVLKKSIEQLLKDTPDTLEVKKITA